MDTAVDLVDAVRRARECAIAGQAISLARWIGSGRRPVTPGGVLRKADVQAAGSVLGVDVPAKLRTMADIPELHRPWFSHWPPTAAAVLRDGAGTGRQV